MHPQAALALFAVKTYHQCGPYAARKYAASHNIFGLYRLARQLESMRHV